MALICARYFKVWFYLCSNLSLIGLSSKHFQWDNGYYLMCNIRSMSRGMDVNVSLCLAIIDLAIDPFIESSHGVI
jgi:hypothetical protein